MADYEEWYLRVARDHKAAKVALARIARATDGQAQSGMAPDAVGLARLVNAIAVGPVNETSATRGLFETGTLEELIDAEKRSDLNQYASSTRLCEGTLGLGMAFGKPAIGRCNRCGEVRTEDYTCRDGGRTIKDTP